MLLKLINTLKIFYVLQITFLRKSVLGKLSRKMSNCYHNVSVSYCVWLPLYPTNTVSDCYCVQFALCMSLCLIPTIVCPFLIVSVKPVFDSFNLLCSFYSILFLQLGLTRFKKLSRSVIFATDSKNFKKNSKWFLRRWLLGCISPRACIWR